MINIKKLTRKSKKNISLPVNLLALKSIHVS